MNNKLTDHNNEQAGAGNSVPETITLTEHEFVTILAGHVNSLVKAGQGDDHFSLHFWGNVNVKVEVFKGTFYFNDLLVGGVTSAITHYMRMCFNANKVDYVSIPGFTFGTIKAKHHGEYWYIVDMETVNKVGKNSGYIGNYHNSFDELVKYAQENYTGIYS